MNYEEWYGQNVVLGLEGENGWTIWVDKDNNILGVREYGDYLTYESLSDYVIEAVLYAEDELGALKIARWLLDTLDPPIFRVRG